MHGQVDAREAAPILAATACGPSATRVHERDVGESIPHCLHFGEQRVTILELCHQPAEHAVVGEKGPRQRVVLRCRARLPLLPASL